MQAGRLRPSLLRRITEVSIDFPTSPPDLLRP